VRCTPAGTRRTAALRTARHRAAVIEEFVVFTECNIDFSAASDGDTLSRWSSLTAHSAADAVAAQLPAGRMNAPPRCSRFSTLRRARNASLLLATPLSNILYRFQRQEIAKNVTLYKLLL